MPTRVPTEEERETRKRLTVNAETVGNAQSNDFPGHWPGEEHHWDIGYFKDTFRVEFEQDATRFDSTFSLVGIDTSIANAFRRILISEVPSLAIDVIYMLQNTSVIQDEVLAHRLGLVPLRASRKGLRWMQWNVKGTEEVEGSRPADNNTVKLDLKIKCEWQEGGLQRAAAGEMDPDRLYKNHNVYARDLEWVPSGLQPEMFADGPVESTNPDIILNKLRPGQEINLEAHAVLGIGQDHAKFSPVATASYRLLPTIDILKPIVGDDAKKFARCFPQGVIELQPITAKDARATPELRGQEGQVQAVVVNPKRDTVSRECLRHAEFKDKVKLGRVRDHFIFKIESTGQWDSDELFVESVKLLKMKCQKWSKNLSALMV